MILYHPLQAGQQAALTVTAEVSLQATPKLVKCMRSLMHEQTNTAAA